MTAERIDYTTGEVVATMTEPEARRATERIRTALDRVSTAWQDLAERVADAYSRRADLALGYGSWAEYTQAEFNVPTLATEVRRELVSLLSAQGMSTRAIAPVVGVTGQRVRQIVSEVASDLPPETPAAEPRRQVVPDVPPEPQDPPRPSWPPTAKPDPAAMPTQNASTMRVNPAVSSATTATPGPSATVPIAPAPSPAAVTGLDGKTYTRRPSTPPAERNDAPTERRRPWPEAADDAAAKLDRIVTTIKGLARDERFTKYRSDQPRFRKSLAEAVAALQAIHDQLTEGDQPS